MSTRRRRPGTLVGDAWQEFVITKQLTSGNGETLIPQLADVPGWFPAIELGMAIDYGPSIRSTNATLAYDNTERRREHVYQQARDVEHNKVLVRARRMSPEESRRALRAKLKAAGYTVRKGKIYALA